MTGMLLSGIMVDTFGWEAVFYTTGCLGIVWFVGWVFLVFETPDDHPRISEVIRI